MIIYSRLPTLVFCSFVIHLLFYSTIIFIEYLLPISAKTKNKKTRKTKVSFVIKFYLHLPLLQVKDVSFICLILFSINHWN